MGCMPATVYCSTTKVRYGARPSSRARLRARSHALRLGFRTASTSATCPHYETGDMPATMSKCRDRKSVVEGKRVSVSVDLGGSRISKKKQQHPPKTNHKR